MMISKIPHFLNFSYRLGKPMHFWLLCGKRLDTYLVSQFTQQKRSTKLQLFPLLLSCAIPQRHCAWGDSFNFFFLLSPLFLSLCICTGLDRVPGREGVKEDHGTRLLESRLSLLLHSSRIGPVIFRHLHIKLTHNAQHISGTRALVCALIPRGIKRLENE